jgi:hypothetical protein
MNGHEEILDRLAACPDACLGCTVTDRDGNRCYLERGHTDRPHLRITHHIQDWVTGEYKGLGWAEWGDDESLIDLPVRECPHSPARDRASCSHVECRAWRRRVIAWARDLRALDTARAGVS